MTINISPADRSFTETGAIFNRAAERTMIARKRVSYMRAGGMIAHYGKESSWDKPASVTTMVGRKTVKGDVKAYVDGIKARLEAKAQAKRRLHDERLAVAAVLSMVPDDAPVSA